MTTDLAVGQARSLLWAARHMQDLLNVVAKVPNADAVQASGCFFPRYCYDRSLETL